MLVYRSLLARSGFGRKVPGSIPATSNLFSLKTSVLKFVRRQFNWKNIVWLELPGATIFKHDLAAKSSQKYLVGWNAFDESDVTCGPLFLFVVLRLTQSLLSFKRWLDGNFCEPVSVRNDHIAFLSHWKLFAEVHSVLELFLSWPTMHNKRAKAYSD